jgi:hypothetical protein
VKATFFDPVPGSLRRERLEAYAAFLAERDGTPDFAQRTLSRREAATASFEQTSLRYDGPFAAALFEAQHRRYDQRRHTPAEVALLLVFVKINANEAYAIDRATRMPRLAGEDLGTRLERLVLLEETYHTRLLLSAAPIFAVRVAEPARPLPITRTIVAGVAGLPHVASRPITFAGEIIGVLTFLRLLGAVRRVFADHPEVRDALEERVTEVLIDEVGHVSFNRLLAAGGAFAALRPILPLIALGTRGVMPEAEALGILPVPVGEALSFDLGALPEEVRRRAFVG